MSPKAEKNISRQPGLDGQVWDTHPMLPLASLPLGMDRAPGPGSAPRDHRPVRARWAQEKPSLTPRRKIAADPGLEGMAQSGGLMAPSILLSLLLKPLTCKALFAPVILHLPSTVPSLAGCVPSSPRPFFVSPHGVLEQPFPQPSLLWLTPAEMRGRNGRGARQGGAPKASLPASPAASTIPPTHTHTQHSSPLG